MMATVRPGALKWYAVRQKIKSLRARFGGTIPRTITSHDFAATAEDFDKFARGSRGRLHDLFAAYSGQPIDKWFHYIPIYEQYFQEALRTFGPKIRMLEIGVFKGGSLQLWRKYFGPQAVIFGVDINPACRDRGGDAAEVRIGSQADAEFLSSVVDEMGGVDLVVDDGSHIGAHQRVSFEVLFPRLSESGFYIIEDLHSSYWPGYFEGGYRKPDTGIEMIKSLIDDMHGPYHSEQLAWPMAKNRLGSIHQYDSVAVLKKETRAKPLRQEFGGQH